MTADARVGVLVYDGFDADDGMGAYDVVATAGRKEVPVDAALVAVEDRDAVAASDGTTVQPDRIVDPADPPSILIVPGGGWNKRAADGAWAAAQRPPTVEAIRGCHETGGLVAGIGTGAMVLAEAGVLAGRRAVTHPATTDELADAGARPVDARIVDDGDVVTAAGDDAGVDLALWLLEREWGPETSEAVAEVIEYEFTADIAPA